MREIISITSSPSSMAVGGELAADDEESAEAEEEDAADGTGAEGLSGGLGVGVTACDCFCNEAEVRMSE